MKAFRIVTALLLLLAMVFSTLPDALLDYFHTHEHAHDCGPETGGMFHLEKEHIHCKNPQLYFRDYDVPPAVVSITRIGYGMVYLPDPRGAVTGTVQVTGGRGPPVTG